MLLCRINESDFDISGIWFVFVKYENGVESHVVYLWSCKKSMVSIGKGELL